MLSTWTNQWLILFYYNALLCCLKYLPTRLNYSVTLHIWHPISHLGNPCIPIIITDSQGIPPHEMITILACWCSQAGVRKVRAVTGIMAVTGEKSSCGSRGCYLLWQNYISNHAWLLQSRFRYYKGYHIFESYYNVMKQNQSLHLKNQIHFLLPIGNDVFLKLKIVSRSSCL